MAYIILQNQLQRFSTSDNNTALRLLRGRLEDRLKVALSDRLKVALSGGCNEKVRRCEKTIDAISRQKIDIPVGMVPVL